MGHPFRSFLVGELAVQPDVLSVELFRRAKLNGYTGGKSALYALVKELRPERPRPVVRFEGLAGESAIFASWLPGCPAAGRTVRSPDAGHSRVNLETYLGRVQPVGSQLVPAR